MLLHQATDEALQAWQASILRMKAFNPLCPLSKTFQKGLVGLADIIYRKKSVITEMLLRYTANWTLLHCSQYNESWSVGGKNHLNAD